MIYELAMVIDKGTYWEVTGVTKNTLDNLANREESLLKLSYMAYKEMSEALHHGDKIITILKPLIHDEVMPGEVVYSVAPEDNNKLSQVRRIRALINPTLSSVSGFTFYTFMVLNNLLNSKGYFIHDDNREEVYLEILETGDSGLINTLERYLNMKDDIHRVSQLDSKFTEITSKIMESSSEDDVVKMADEFIEEHYKNNS
jgi:hypothetical protein